MSTFKTQQNLIEGLYVGYFGHAGVPSGVNYWSDQLALDAMTLYQIAASFAGQSEATGLYPYLAAPSTTHPANFIDQIFQGFFKRAPGWLATTR